MTPSELIGTATASLAERYPDATPAELLGLLVGQTLGAVYAEREQARAIAEDLARKLSEGLTFLDQVVTYAEGTAPTFAQDGDMVKAARVWLDLVKADHAVPSPQTPEQETT